MDTIAAFDHDSQLSQLDRLIAELSSTLLRAHDGDLADPVEHALGLIGAAIGADRCVFVEFAASKRIDSDASHWARPDVPPLDTTGIAPALELLFESANDDADALVLEQVPTAAAADLSMTSAVIVRSTLSAVGGERRTTALAVGMASDFRYWPYALVERLRIVTRILTASLGRDRREQALADSQIEIERLRARLEGARPAVARAPAIEGFDEIVGDSPQLRSALALLQEVASTDSTVLLLGETGTGKELFAKALHSRSARQKFPIVTVNCAALPPTLIESELFGHERGAFTDAVTQRRGRFEIAHQGTLFLDEIGDLPLELQAKLLRVLQEGEFERLGSSRSCKVDVRIVAATHQDLKHAVSEGEFREDLYYRLNVFPIRLPPLRERREDIPALVWSTIHRRQHAMRRTIAVVAPEAMETLQRYDWPGNIRQLENVVERALIHSTGDSLLLLPGDIDDTASSTADDPTALATVERAHIEKILRECAWRINGAGNAAERLGLHPNTLRFRMQKLGIFRAQPSAAPPPRQAPARSR